MKTLTGKTAIITGAAAPNGIGSASARRLAANGAAVVVVDIAGPLQTNAGTKERLDLLSDLVADIQAVGGRALSVQTDVTQADQVKACVARTVETFGGVDILVNNAGTTVGTGPFLESDPADWNTSYRVNLLGPMLFCQAVIPHMQRVGGGSIVNVGSTGSLGADAGFGAYTTMKHGLIGLTKTLAAEFGVNGIRCNAVCPGYTMTDMHMGANSRIAAERGLPVEDVMTERYASVALRRAGTPEEVAEAIAHLAGPSSAYTTGIALPVAGGLPVGL